MDQHIQTAPQRFQILEFAVVQHRTHRIGQRFIDTFGQAADVRGVRRLYQRADDCTDQIIDIRIGVHLRRLANQLGEITEFRIRWRRAAARTVSSDT